MHIDIYDLCTRFPGWQDDLDVIVGETRGELVAWAFLNDYEEIVAPSIFEAFAKVNEQSSRRDIAEWLMNMYVDNGTPNAWLYQTRDLHWDACRWFLEKYLPEEEAKYVYEMSYRDDIAAYKEARDMGEML